MAIKIKSRVKEIMAQKGLGIINPAIKSRN
jgi:hypothetical protein